MTRWPPASVWLTAGWLAGPPAALTVATAGEGVCLLAVLFAPGLMAAYLVVAGHRLGVALGRSQATLVGLVAAYVVMATVSREPNGGAARAKGWVYAAVAGGWAVALAGLLHWPETRRWCGLLPPADPEGDP